MTRALAELVAVDQFRPGALGYDVTDGIGVDCPACDWTSDATETLGDMLTTARRHVLDHHAGPDPFSREHAYTAVLHAVDQLHTDAYPALLTETELLADHTTRQRRRCEASGNTVRGPLLPLEQPDGRRIWVCRVCFARHRRNVAHLDTPLALTTDQEGGDTRA